MNFEIDDALRFVRERIADTQSDIHHVATEITFMQQAANQALAAIDVKVEEYKQNLKILLQEYDKKHTDRAAAAASSGREPPHVEALVYNNAQSLREAVKGMADVEYRAGYDVELTRYWRQYGGRAEASRYQQLWQWVQRRHMPSMD